MLCDICKKNEAVVHYAEVVNGEIKKINICEECAKKKGFTEVSFSMGDILGGMVSDIAQGFEKIIAPEEQCDRCGMTYDEFRKYGRLGCDNCYKVFEKKLISIIDTIHKHTRHKGKVPTAYREKYIKIEEIRELNKQLKEAVEKEEYEKAAVLRDKIRELKEKLNISLEEESGD